jgi:phenylacetate-coenzyme A ligase PaaK-like adenylate-forming protein
MQMWVSRYSHSTQILSSESYGRMCRMDQQKVQAYESFRRLTCLNKQNLRDTYQSFLRELSFHIADWTP